MNAAANTAFANRQVITHRVREVFAAVFGRDPRALDLHVVYDGCHDTAKVERHRVDGTEHELVVHRKGATRVFGPGSPDVPRGAIARHAFHSTVANDDREFFVYTPPAYEAKRSRPYPVLYLLHGLGDDAERWRNGGAANVILDNLIA